MITCKCETKDNSQLTLLKPFQGTLKKRTAADIDALCQSLKEDGLLMPFAVWKDNYLLDGHARFEALIKLALEDPTILEQAFPVLRIEAETEAEARAALLQITSTYGHVTRKGMATFVAAVPNFKCSAPIVLKTLGVAATSISKAPKTVEEDTVVLRLKVAKTMVPRLTEVLRNVDGVVVL